MALIVLCHPSKVSLNNIVKETIKNSLELQNFHVIESFLYEQVENIRNKSAEFVDNELEKIRNSSLIVLQFPTYFVSFPALLQDYIWLLTARDPLCFSGKKILVSSTFGGTREDYNEGGCRGSLEYTMGELYKITFGKTGCHFLQPIQFFRDEYEVPIKFNNRINWIEDKLNKIEAWPLKSLNLETDF